MTNLKALTRAIIPVIETSLQSFVESLPFPNSAALKEMLTYHMGWADQGRRGKRIRPLLMLLIANAFKRQTMTVMPAAVAIELLHNFTLIHDDIEDQSSLRHGRQTLWKKFGAAQAINAGDALFSIAQLSMLTLKNTCGETAGLKAAFRLNETCLHLTQGQYLDMAFEHQTSVNTSQYLTMIRGKTAALISLTAELGGIATHQPDPINQRLADFGENLGLAFQTQDDIIGIWGDPAITGKSAASDLISRKKSLPIIYGLENCPTFLKKWETETITKKNAPRFADLLVECGAKTYALEMAAAFTQKAMGHLAVVFPKENEFSQAVNELVQQLLNRNA
jgi:geranylgeranyl diphosphate synthase type I